MLYGIGGKFDLASSTRRRLFVSVTGEMSASSKLSARELRSSGRSASSSAAMPEGCGMLWRRRLLLLLRLGLPLLRRGEDPRDVPRIRPRPNVDAEVLRAPLRVQRFARRF